MQEQHGKKSMRRDEPVSASHAGAPGCAEGTWELNVTRSEFGGEPAPRRRVIEVTCSTEKRFAWTMRGVTSGGHEIAVAWSGPVDGTPCEPEGRRGWTMAFRWQGDVLRTEATTPVSTREEETVFSADGKTMHIHGVEKSEHGERRWEEVYERKQPAFPVIE